jgi:hypothetical protein
MYSLTARIAARSAVRTPAGSVSRIGGIRSVGGTGSTTHDNDPEVRQFFLPKRRKRIGRAL